MSLLTELRRRNVIRMAGLYLVGAWLIVQVASTLLPIFHTPAWVLQSLVVLLAVGLVPALVFSWLYELTPEGLKRDAEAEVDANTAKRTARRMDRAIVVGLLVVIALMVVERVWFAGRDAPSTANPPAAPPGNAGSARIDSIAVLPFRNEGSGEDSEYLSDGLAESLIYRLAQVSDLTVSPRSSVFEYKDTTLPPLEVGRKLGVASIMSGRLVQRGEDLTISVELVDVVRNRVLWGEQYRRKLSELLETQRDIAAEIAERLQLRLSGEEAAKFGRKYTDSNEAYRRYLEGRYHFNQRTADSIGKAIERFRAAAEADPEFALAFTGLADCYLVQPYYQPVRSDRSLAQARTYATRALAIDDQLAEVHTSMAYVHQGEWQWDAAEKEYQRALALNPRYATAQLWYARLQVRLGRFDEGLAGLRKAQSLEPLSRVLGDNIAQALLIRGEVEAAEAEAKRLVEFDAEFPGGYQRLSQVYLAQGRYEEALATAEQGLERVDWSRLRMSQARALVALGRAGDGTEFAGALEARYAAGEADAVEVAEIHASLGDASRAFEWLQRALADRSALLVDIRASVELIPLREDPRFAAILAAMRMPASPT